MRARKHTQIIASPAGSELEQKARDEGFPVASLARLRARLKGVQIVHAHTGRGQTLAWSASVGLTVKRIATRHVAFEPRYPLIHRLKYTYLCDGVIAVSQAAQRAAIGAGVPGNRIEIIPTGVEVREVPDEQQRRDARREWNLEPGDFAVGHLGAFTQEKGQDVAVQALALLKDRMPNLRMILAGEGPMRATLQASLPASSLILPGHIQDSSRLLAALDLFIMPSRSEGWGLAALEAMASGLPVLASDTGGLAEMIDAEETGWLISPGNPRALADGILAAASDREKLRAMGLRARSRAQRFSIEETARRTEEFYVRMLNGS